MARSHLRYTAKDTNGNVIQNALVNVYLQGTTTPVSDMYAGSSGGSPITTLTSNGQGEVEAWFTTAKFVDLNVTDNGDTAHYPGSSELLSGTAFTETVEVHPPPSEIDRLHRVDVTAYPYLATGDGTTDDSTAVTAAATAAIAAGRPLYLPGGKTFRVNQLALTSGAVLWLEGTIKKPVTSPSNNALVSIDGSTTPVDDVLIFGGGTIDADNFIDPYSGGTVTSRNCLQVKGDVDGVTVRDITLQNAGRDNVNIFDSGGAWPTNVLIENCRMTTATRWAVALVGGTFLTVRGCYIEGGGLGGIDLEPNAPTPQLSDITIERNRIIGRSTATSIPLNATQPGGYAGITDRAYFLDNDVTMLSAIDSSCVRISGWTDSIIRGNTIRNAPSTAINVSGSDGTVVAYNHIIESQTQGSAPSTTTGSIFVVSDRVIVIGNVIEGSYWSGIVIDASLDCVIADNVIYNVGQGFTDLGFDGYGIYLFNAQNCVVTGNKITDDQGSPTMKYGIWTRESGGTCAGNRIFANPVSGFRTAETSIAAAHVSPAKFYGVEFPEGYDLTIGSSTGSKIGQSGSKIGFYGVTPVVRPTALTQTYSTADPTLSAYTSDPESSAYTAAADGEAKLADLNSLRVAYENLRVFVEDLAAFHNSHVDHHQSVGLEQ